MSIVEKSIQILKGRGGEPGASLTVVGEDTRGLPHAAQPRNDLPPLKYDYGAGSTSGFDPVSGHQGQLLSQIRALKRKVLDRVRERRKSGESPVVLITSAAPGDGKSFMSFHLALGLTTERDLSVTLIDADVARQRTSGLFSGTEDGGLTGCLLNDLPLATAVRHVSLQNLSVVRAGARHPSASESLTSSRWDDLVREMRAAGGSRMFVVDSAPVLATAEAQYLAQTADLVLFVVRAEVTPQQAVAEALNRLGDLSRVAFVLNGYVSVGTDFFYDYSNYDAQSHASTTTPSKK